MNRVLKKLIAVALTGAMVLSLGVSAMASGDLTNALTNGGSGLEGDVTNEGPLPAEVLRFTTSTVTSTSFDLIVDPHDLIRTSAAAEKAKTAYSGKTFADGAYAFFAKVEEGETSYGKESNTLTVTNKSSTPISVDFTTSIDRTKLAASAVTMVDTEAELATLAKKAGLYLAIKNGDTQAPVSQNTFGDLTVTIPANLQAYVIGSKFEWVDGVSNALKKALNDEVGAGKTFAVTLTKATSASAGDGKIKIDDATWTANTVTTDAATKLADTVNSNTRIMTINVPDGSKATPVAKVTFYFDMAAVKAKSDADVTGENITLAKWDGNPFAEVKTTIDNHATAYTTQANSANTGYEKVLDTSVEDFPEKSFNLVAAINRDDAWDSVATSAIADAIVVVWKVDAYTAPADPVVTVTAPAVKNGEVAHVTYTVGKGTVTAVDVLNVTYEADGKTTTAEAGAGSLTVNRPAQAGDPNPRAFDLTVATKMLAEGVPETAKVTFLMSDGSTKAVGFNFTQEG